MSTHLFRSFKTLSGLDIQPTSSNMGPQVSNRCDAWKFFNEDSDTEKKWWEFLKPRRNREKKKGGNKEDEKVKSKRKKK